MGKEKRIHHRNRCQWTTLLRSFSSERGNNQQVFPPPWSEFCCGHPQTSKAVRGCRSIRLTEQHQLPLRSLSTEVHFHCLMNFCVCLKHTLCLGKGLSFPFGDPTYLTMSTHPFWTETAPSNKSHLEYCTSQCTVEMKRKRDMTLCQTLTPSVRVLTDFQKGHSVKVDQQRPDDSLCCL